MVKIQGITSILFDLDGTLVDTLPDMRSAMNQLLALMNGRPVSLAEMRGWIGDGVAALTERSLAATGVLDDVAIKKSVDRFMNLYEARLTAESRVYPRVESTLRQLHADGYRLGVCTNKPTSLSIAILRDLGLSRYFSAFVGGDTAAGMKPHPAHLFATLKQMNAQGTHALMVGDSSNDVAAARAAKIPVVVVSYGYSRGVATDLAADAVIDSFDSLLQIV